MRKRALNDPSVPLSSPNFGIFWLILPRLDKWDDAHHPRSWTRILPSLLCHLNPSVFQSRALVIQDGPELLLLPPWLPALRQESNQASHRGPAGLSPYTELFAVVKGVQ